MENRRAANFLSMAIIPGYNAQIFTDDLQSSSYSLQVINHSRILSCYIAQHKRTYQILCRKTNSKHNCDTILPQHDDFCLHNPIASSIKKKQKKYHGYTGPAMIALTGTPPATILLLGLVRLVIFYAKSHHF